MKAFAPGRSWRSESASYHWYPRPAEANGASLSGLKETFQQQPLTAKPTQTMATVRVRVDQDGSGSGSSGHAGQLRVAVARSMFPLAVPPLLALPLPSEDCQMLHDNEGSRKSVSALLVAEQSVPLAIRPRGSGPDRATPLWEPEPIYSVDVCVRRNASP